MAWWELGELICYSLRDLGFKAEIQHRKMEKNCINILLGAFKLEPEYIKKIPSNTIFVNTEQLYKDDQKLLWPSDIYDWARNFETWDYSDRNIEKFNEHGIFNVKKLDIGYQKELSRIQNSPIQDIDILFYGAIRERRKKIIDDLKSEGLNVHAFTYPNAIWGTERDNLIARSKIILNLHHYDSHIFESVRVFYLLANKKAVVSEISKTTSINEVFYKSIEPASYEELVGTCKKLIANNQERHFLEKKGFDTFSMYPQKNFTARML